MRFSILLSSVLLALDLPAATYNNIHPFAGGASDGSTPTYGSALIASGSTLYGMSQGGGSANQGALFKLSATGTGFQVIHSFAGYTVLNTNASKNDGALPYGKPVLIDSTLYGTTTQGGSNGFGIVFKVNTDGSSFQVLHHFGALKDGSIPEGSLITDGTFLYGTTYGGGTNFGAGTAFKLDLNGGNYQIIHHFGSGLVAGGDGMAPWGGLTMVGSNLCGLDWNAAFKMNTDGTGYQILHRFSGPDGADPTGTFTAVGTTLYGMTLHGGSGSVGTIFKIDLSGANFQTLHTFTISEARNPYGDVTISGSTLYGMSSAGVTNYLGNPLGSGSVFQMDLDGSNYQILHTFLFPINNQDGSMPLGSLLLLNSKLYGMTQTGGSVNNNLGCIFTLTTGSGSGTTDSTPPTVTITSPKANLGVSNEVFTATGTAKDNVAVASVYFKLNNGAWVLASTTNNFANWTALMALSPGPNVLSAYAIDTSGNPSSTNSVKFTYVLSAPLDIQIVGQGTVTPNYDGKMLAVSNSYSVTAKPGKGFKFQSWTGDVPSASPKLTFVMRSNLVLVANFVDSTRPANIVTTPGVNKTVATSPFTAAGKSKDNAGVSNVWYQLNGSGWLAATTTNAFTNWTSSDLDLFAGPNLFQAFAVDAAGNASSTNSVKFTYKVASISEWAPDSLNGLLLQVQPSSGLPESVGFDLSTFSQTGNSGDTNADDFGVGLYAYVKTGTNTAQLSLTNTLPANTNSDALAIQLIFTNHYSGIFTNENGDTGSLSATIDPAFAPFTLAGRTIIAKRAGSTKTTTVTLAANGTFSKTPANNGGPGTSSGTYEFDRFSPTTGALVLTYTDAADVGSSTYAQLTFSSATAGSYFVNSFDNTGTSEDIDTGTFTLK